MGFDKGRGGPRGGPRSNGGNTGGGFNRGFGGPKEMHKAVCAECKQECEVPFKPTEGKPVYCRECYRNKKRFQTGKQNFSTSVSATP